MCRNSMVKMFSARHGADAGSCFHHLENATNRLCSLPLAWWCSWVSEIRHQKVGNMRSLQFYDVLSNHHPHNCIMHNNEVWVRAWSESERRRRFVWRLFNWRICIWTSGHKFHTSTVYNCKAFIFAQHTNHLNGAKLRNVAHIYFVFF